MAVFLVEEEQHLLQGLKEEEEEMQPNCVGAQPPWTSSTTP